MAAVVNDRDVLIMSAVPRYNAPANRDMFLSPPSAIFKVATDGLSAAPSSFAFQATLLNLIGTVTFTATAGITLSVSGNTATLTFANFAAANGTITASTTVDGVTYSKVSTVTKLADGAAGAPGLNSPPQTAAQLKDTLFGQITTDQFVASISTTLGLVTASAATAGSVAAQVKAEADARISAISTEVTDRGAAISTAMAAEVAARNSYVQTWAYSKDASDQSLAQMGTTITAAYRTYTDTKTGQALTDAKAFTQSYGYSIADANSAIAASASTLNANITSAVNTAKAYTETWGYSKAQIDTAEAAQFNTLTTNYQGYANGVGAAATSAAAADVRSYTMSTSGINGAISTASSTLTANYTNAINAIQIGGRNLYKKTSAFQFYNGATLRTRLDTGFQLTGVAANTGLVRLNQVIPAAGTYTLSFDLVVGSANGYPLTIDLCDNLPVWIINPTTAATAGSHHYSKTFVVTNWSAGSLNFVDFDGLSGQEYVFTNLMLEVGNKESAYMPAPEDVAADIVAAQSAAVVTAAADVRAYTTSSANITAAISASSTSLTSSFQSADATNLAAAKTYADATVATYTYSKSDITGAIASSTNTVSARLNNIGGVTMEQTFTAQASAITGLGAQWAVKIDSNGSISGITLASGGGSPTTTFAVVADKFVLKFPGANALTPFAIGNVAGQSVIGINGSTIIDGSLVVRAANGAVILSAGGLQSGFEAPRTRNADLAPVVSNLIPSNSLPTSVNSFTAAASTGAPGISSWEGPAYDPASQWSPNQRGAIYTHAFGTPTAGSLIDMYWLGSDSFAKRFPVIPKQRYEFSAALSAHRCRGYLVAVFYKSNGDYITEAASNFITDGWNYGNNPGDNFPRALIFAVAPDAAAVVMVVSRQYHTGDNNPYVFTSEMYMGVASATQTIGTRYTDFSANGLSASIAANKAVADAAIARVNADADYNVLSRSEKAVALKDWRAIDAREPLLVARAAALGVASTDYTTKKLALLTYLQTIGAGGSDWWNTGFDNTIVGDTYLQNWTNYYAAEVNLQNNLDAKAATTASWSDGVYGALKPEDSATRGATLGVNVGGQITAANAAALVGANAITNTMFGGDLLSTNWNGGTDSNGAGWALSRSGVLYCNDVRARGTFSTGAFTPNYAWPAAGGGCHLSGNGLLLGNPNEPGMGYIEINSSGTITAPGLSLYNRQLTLTNTILIAPKIGDNMVASISGGGYYVVGTNVQFTDLYVGTYTASITNSSGNLAYSWNSTSASGFTTRVSSTGGATIQVYATGKLFQGQELDFFVTCTVADLNSSVSKPASANSQIAANT